MLTKRQKQVLEFIKSYLIKNEIAPSLEEIKEYLKLSSVSTAHHHVKELEDQGYLEKEENQPRSINICRDELMIQIPLLGAISAGMPIEALEEKETITIPKSKFPKTSSIFGLRVHGNSMIDENISDNDIVIIKSQPAAENGQKVVALINNNEVILKKIYKEKRFVRLQPANEQYEPILVEPENLSIQGIVVDVIKTAQETKPNFNIRQLIVRQIKENKSHDYLKKWINTVQQMDCVEGMQKLPDNSINLIVTSPPYDAVRNYNGFSYDLHETGKEIYRILKDGGIAAMVIQDQTKNFGKSLTAFRTIVDWCDNIGFKLFETIIYKKHGAEGAWWTKRFRVDHEYIPIFLKGEKPQYFNKEHLKIPSKHGGRTMTGCATRLTNGQTLNSKKVTINLLKCRGTIWDYTTCGDGTRLKHQHPATFPDKIPYDLIRCFCPEDGIVLDPFIGSGTTALAAIQLDKNYLGFDISEEYCDLSKRRIKMEGMGNKKLF